MPKPIRSFIRDLAELRQGEELSRNLEQTEYFKPTQEVRTRDIVREIPKASIDVAKGIGNFAKNLVRGLPRAIGTTIATFAKPFTGISEYDTTKNPITRAVFGKEPIREVQTRGERALAEIGFSEQRAKTLGGFAGVTAAGLEFIPGAGKAKNFVTKLAKTANKKQVVSILKKLDFNTEVIGDIAERIAKTQNPQEITYIIKSQAVIKNIEKRVGIKAPEPLKIEIEKRVSALDEITDPIEHENALKSLMDEVVDEAPKKPAQAKIEASTLIDEDDKKLMEQFIDDVRLNKKVDVDVEIKARKIAEDAGLNIEKTNAKVADDFAEIIDRNREGIRRANASKIETPIQIPKETKTTGWSELQKTNPDLFNKGILRKSHSPMDAQGIIPEDIHSVQGKWQNYGQDSEVSADVLYKRIDSGSFKGEYEDALGNPVRDPQTGNILRDTYDEATGEWIKPTVSTQQLKEHLLEKFKTPEGKKYLDEVISSLPKNSDGTITAYRIGEIRKDGTQSYTLSEGMAKTFSNQGTDVLPAGTPGLPRGGYKDFGSLPANTVKIDPKSIRAWSPYDAEILVEAKGVKSPSPIQTVGKAENLAGAVVGVEKDEEGKTRINPLKAGLGIAGISAVKNPKIASILDDAVKKYKITPKTSFSIFKKSQAPIIKAESESALKRGIEKLLTPISTRLENISPELKNRMRQLEFSSMNETLKNTNEVLPFLKAQAKLSKSDRAVFDLARKNGDETVINAIAEKYDIQDELKAVRKTLDDIFDKAESVGMDVGYRGNYFPRVIKDPKGFLAYFQKSDDWSQISNAIIEKAEKMGIHPTDLTDEDKASIINSMLRGYGNKITLSAPGATKERTIDFIDETLDKFYEKTDASLVQYISKMNDEIAGRKFFGKELGVDGKSINVSDSIGSYVMKLIADGKIKPSQEKELSDILKARFNKGKMNEALQTFRNVEYISTMGNPLSAITQIGDMAWTLYDNGIYHSIKGFAKSLGKKGVTRNDLGIDKIAQEFTEPSKSAKAVERIFKLVGLDKMDRLGKETFINANLSKYTALAKKGDKKLAEDLKFMFPMDEAKQTFQELANGQLTDNVKYVLFNRLLDFQPISKSEMPQKYLEMPNGRIFYMLKSFTLKQIDVFRREAGRDILSKDPKRVANGLRKLVGLSASFMLANATADEIKDTILGRETSLTDRTIDNIARLFGASKYDVYKVREEGLGAGLAKKILFPTSIVDAASKDIENVLTGKKYKSGKLEGQPYKLELPQRIPLGGKLYYWWFGRGQQKTQYKEKATTSTSSKNTPLKNKTKPIGKTTIKTQRKPLK